MAQTVIAVRGGEASKSRCAPALTCEERGLLTLAMLEDMLAASARCAEVTATWVVTPTAELARRAEACGARPIWQDEPASLNGAFELAQGVVRAAAPSEPVLLLPGDLPTLDPDDLAAAAHLARSHAVVLAPALDGGTGLLGLGCGATLRAAFGEDSFHRHAALAAGAGLSLAVLEATSLQQDVDHPADLARVVADGRATRTAALLRGLGGGAKAATGERTVAPAPFLLLDLAKRVSAD